jgi:cystathionine beta-lyase/cystathionine gamma-synthase
LLGATQVPVVLSAAFGYRDMDEWLDVAMGKAEGHIYTRNSNPTIRVFEEKVRLEDAEAATSAASGMGIISSTLFALLASGNRVVSVKDTCGGTSAIFNEYMPKYRIDAVQCDTADHDQIEAEIAQGCTLLYLETPTNPTTKIIDIARLSLLAPSEMTSPAGPIPVSSLCGRLHLVGFRNPSRSKQGLPAPTGGPCSFGARIAGFATVRVAGQPRIA